MSANLSLIYGFPFLLDRLMDQMDFMPFPVPWDASVRHFPPLQLVEGETAFHLRAVVPGISFDDLHLTFANGVLSLSGSIPFLPGRHLRRDRPIGPFKRDVRLPAPVRAEAITSSANNGILTVILPKTHGEACSKPQKEGLSVRDRVFGKETGKENARVLTVAPLIDMVELSDGVHLYCNLPNATPEAVAVTLEGKRLHIRAISRLLPIQGKIHALEFCDIVYEGTVLLPSVDTTRIEAFLSNGLLRITMPFAPEAHLVRIPVTAG